MGGRTYRHIQRYADPSSWPLSRHRWTLALWGALLLVHVVSPAQAAKKKAKKAAPVAVESTVVEHGAADAPYHLTIFGDLGCPADTPNLSEWWKTLQDPEIASLTRVTYRHAPKKATKNTKVATHSALAAGTSSPALFFEVAARACEIVRDKPKAKLKKSKLGKAVAKMGLTKKEFGKIYKKNKKNARKVVKADVKTGKAHFSKPDAPLYLVNDAPMPFSAPAAFKAWVLAQEKAKAEAAEAAKAAQEPPEPERLQIAVYDIEATEVSPAVTRVVRDALTAELRKMSRVTVILSLIHI